MSPHNQGSRFSRGKSAGGRVADAQAHLLSSAPQTSPRPLATRPVVRGWHSGFASGCRPRTQEPLHPGSGSAPGQHVLADIASLLLMENTMTRRFNITLLALFVLAVTAGAPAFAHEGDEHKVLGTVMMAAPDHVMLKDKDGKDVTVHIAKNTKVLKDKKAMKVEDIKTGTRVVVTAVTEKEKMMARTIEVGAAPETKQ